MIKLLLKLFATLIVVFIMVGINYTFDVIRSPLFFLPLALVVIYFLYLTVIIMIAAEEDENYL